MAEKLIRHWHILRNIPRAPKKIDPATLEQRLQDAGINVTRRTIQRDLPELSEVFPLVSDDEHKPYGWSWAREAQTWELPGLDLHTAVTLQLVRAHLLRALPPATIKHLEDHFARADAIVAAAGAGGLKAWNKRLRIASRFQPLLPPRIPDDVVAAVYDALLRERTLDVEYRGREDDEAKNATLHPLGLVLRDGAIYLVCTYFDYDDVRYLPLHRFLTVEATAKKRRAPKGFSLDEYLGSGEFGFLLSERQLKLELHVDEMVAKTLEETALSEDQTVTSNGGTWVVKATVPDTRTLRGWILSYGTLIEVLKPASLRSELAITVQEMASQYWRAE